VTQAPRRHPDVDGWPPHPSWVPVNSSGVAAYQPPFGTNSTPKVETARPLDSNCSPLPDGWPFPNLKREHTREVTHTDQHTKDKQPHQKSCEN
jgi:hypothetical protein